VADLLDWLSILWERKASKARMCEALRGVGEGGRPADAARIFRILFDADQEIASEAAHAVAMLMRKTGPTEWTTLYPPLGHIQLKPLDVALLDTFGSADKVHLLGVATLNRNGYVRQEALSRLGTIQDEYALPYLILRLADWVPEIRELAERLVREAIERRVVRSIADYSFLIKWMERVGRVDLKPIRTAMIQAMMKRDPAELRAALEHENPDVRLFCYRAVLVDTEVQPEVVERGLGDAAVKIRMAMVHLIAAQKPSCGVGWLRRLYGDRNPAVRVAAVRAAAEAYGVDGAFDKMIFDASAGVRDAARFYLRKYGREDFAPRYREEIRAVEMVPRLVGILGGLSETGTVSDYNVVASFLDHPNAVVRSAALYGVARLDARRAFERLVRALEDPSAKVRNTAIKKLVDVEVPEKRDAVLPVFESGRRPGSWSALRVLCRIGSWSSLRDILFALETGDSVLETFARREANRWISAFHNRLFTEPEIGLAEEIVRLAGRMQWNRAEEDSQEEYAREALKSFVERARRAAMRVRDS
jgi:HEAT repeat protein